MIVLNVNDARILWRNVCRYAYRGKYLDIQKRIFLISRFMNIKINYRHSTILIILSRIGRVHNILIYVEDSKTEDSAYYLYTLFP